MVTIIRRIPESNYSDDYEIMIDSPDDLNSVGFTCSPGSIAYTAGFGAIYHKDANGNWIEV